MPRISACCICMLVLSFPTASFAQFSYADSETGPLSTTAPTIINIAVHPVEAQSGDTVTISFTVSRTLHREPDVLVNGAPAVVLNVDEYLRYTAEYKVRRSDSSGTAQISIAVVDTLGNEATASMLGPLVIKEMPVNAWTVFLVLLVSGICILARRRRRTVACIVLAATGLLLSSAGLAQAPQVSNVRFIQGPDEAGGTKVDIYYDLIAPGHSCTISVALSKNGGADGFPYPVSAVSGDLLNVGTGQDHHIVWKISEDYPNDDIPEARIRITADEVFSFVFMTDTHLGMKCSETNLARISQWIVSQAADKNICYVGHLGDVCDDRTATSLEVLMPKARLALQPVMDADIPFSVAVGNHDYRYSVDEDKRSAAAFNLPEAFGRAFYDGKSWFGGTFEDESPSPGPYPGGTVNHYITRDIAGLSFLFLTLEHYPRDKVLDWADNLVRNVYPNHQVIVITHAYLTEYGNLSSGSGYASGEAGPEFSNTGSNMWERYFKNWENLRMILNGHFVDEPRQAYKSQTGAHGNIVHSHFFNYQNWGYRLRALYFVTSGGLHQAATIRTFTVYPASNKVVIQGYTPSANTVIETAVPESYEFIVDQ